MQEAEFRAWLQANGANTEAGRNTRVHAVKTIERKLPELGSPFKTLAEAWTNDRFQHLRERIRQMRQSARDGDQDFRILMPESQKPFGRLSSWNSWLAQYGNFLAGETNSHMKDADRIRQYVLEYYIQPARKAEQQLVDVLVSDVNRALGLNQAWPNICQALAGKMFQDLAEVPPPERIGADQSSATVFRFDLSDVSLGWAEAELRRRYGDPIADTDKMVGFALHDDRQVALQRDVSGTQIWIEDTGTSPHISSVRRYAAEEPRHSNLPGRLKHRLSRRHKPRAVTLVKIGNPDELRSLLDWYESHQPLNGNPPGSNGEDSVQPTNLILFGPPGTGKTYATAAEALRLCGEEIPEDRGELMAAYRRLTEAGRIEFVTFHQSYAYEEFVEGLRPVQQEEHSAGFHLEAEAGVLRRVARRAETSTGSGGPAFTIGDRQVFKMSIGEAANPDDAHLFEEAIAGGYTLLGFEDIDWSDDKFANRDAIINAVKAHGVIGSGEPNAMSGRVQMPFIFRNWVKPGDIIVVSKGNSLFRAIGEVTGEYQFEPREGGDYGHRRTVRWLWVDRTGVSVSEIYSRNFTMKSIYSLVREDLNVPALERYIASQQTSGTGGAQSFVLIIDEINRANVSKVMGELITLLEPDKRIGATNELRVRLPYSRDIFGLPPNLHIIGTMNTADRSIALLDTALRRRFSFKEVPPEPKLLEKAEQATGLPLVNFLSAINDRIEYLLDREHRIGHAYFMKCRTRGAVDAVMRDAVIPLLQEYFFEDLSRVAVVLGESKGGGFLNFRQIKDPLGEGDARDSWSVLPSFTEDAYHRCVKPDSVVQLLEPATQAAE